MNRVRRLLRCSSQLQVFQHFLLLILCQLPRVRVFHLQRQGIKFPFITTKGLFVQSIHVGVKHGLLYFNLFYNLHLTGLTSFSLIGIKSLTVFILFLNKWVAISERDDGLRRMQADDKLSYPTYSTYPTVISPLTIMHTWVILFDPAFQTSPFVTMSPAHQPLPQLE